MPDRTEISNQIKQKALELGFAACGISKADHLKKDAGFLKSWLDQKKHGNMHYMENHFEKRTDPSKLVDGAQTVISLLYNYYPKKFQNPNTKYKISKYAYGKDYHKVLKKKLKELFAYINNLSGREVRGRYFVDSAPVLERSLAEKAGLGWIGKNTMLIHPEIGSYTFLSEIIIDLELVYEHQSMADQCGRCVACLKACPTGALDITKPYQINASLCISYNTIENKAPDKQALKGNRNWIFGCDVCQDVCPWNRKAPFTEEEKFNISDFIKNAEDKEWKNLRLDQFDENFKGNPVYRAKYEGLKRNIQLIS